MRLTVGPLPPAVYWRRRAVVLGAVLLFLIVLVYSCNGTDRRDPDATGGQPSPTGSVLTPHTGNPPATPDGSGGGPGGANDQPPGGGTPDGGTTGGGTNEGGTNDGVAPVVDDGTCTDAELKVTPVAVPATAQRGATVILRLKVKNVSDRTCSRDVGADLQELFIKSGAEKVWSSDTCGTAKGSDVQSFTPNFERAYEVTWNGKSSSRCANGAASGSVVPAGTYEVFARVGTKLSEPVKLTITA